MAPKTAILVIFELTGDRGSILPLMLAVVVSTAPAGRLSPGSIRALKLKRRGIDLDRHHVRHPAGTIPAPQAARR